MDLSTTPEELFMLLGEAQFIRRKLESKIKEHLLQADEMSKVITGLKAEIEVLKNGRLEQPNNNDAV